MQSVYDCNHTATCFNMFLCFKLFWKLYHCSSGDSFLLLRHKANRKKNNQAYYKNTLVEDHTMQLCNHITHTCKHKRVAFSLFFFNFAHVLISNNYVNVYLRSIWPLRFIAHRHNRKSASATLILWTTFWLYMFTSINMFWTYMWKASTQKYVVDKLIHHCKRKYQKRICWTFNNGLHDWSFADRIIDVQHKQAYPNINI